MKLLVAFSVLIFLFASCKKDVIRGNGETVTIERTVPSFTGIDASGDGIITITYAPATSVQLKGYSNLIPHYVTEVKNGVLYVHYEDKVVVKNNQLSVLVTMPSFNSLTLSGDCSVDAKGAFDSTAQLSLSTSGNAKVNIEQMNTAFYNLLVSGNGDVSALGLNAASAKLEISGNGNASLSVRDKLEVNISGNGKVSYKGNPADVITNISGHGTLEKL